MQIIDAHQHFWKYNAVSHSWIDDSMSVLKRDFLPSDLERVYWDNGISGCIAVQADQSTDETDFLLSLAEQHDFIKGVVGWIDICAPDLEQQLSRLADNGKLKGFRHVVQDEPDDQFMLQPKFQKGLAILQDKGFTYDILIYPRQMSAALKTIQRLPELKMVIDHLAKPDIKIGTAPGWQDHIVKMASYNNVYCKISGMVTEADWTQWSYEDFVPWLDVVFEAFGVDHVMFGSDWPVCQLAANYDEVLAIVMRYISAFAESDQRKIMGQNALKFYNL